MRVISAAQLVAATRLLIVADVNAVPPSGIEGLEMNANGTPLGRHGALGIGPLAIGNIKYRTESALDPLRNRPDFRALMMDHVMPTEPFAR